MGSRRGLNRAGGEQRLDVAAYPGYERVAVLAAEARGLDRRTHPDAHRDGLDDPAPLPHCGASALDGDGDDGRLRQDGHDEATLLERQQILGPAARTFREDEKGIAAPDRSRAGLDRAHRGLLVSAIDGNESAHTERARQNRNAI